MIKLRKRMFYLNCIDLKKKTLWTQLKDNFNYLVNALAKNGQKVRRKQIGHTHLKPVIKSHKCRIVYLLREPEENKRNRKQNKPKPYWPQQQQLRYRRPSPPERQQRCDVSWSAETPYLHSIGVAGLSHVSRVYFFVKCTFNLVFPSGTWMEFLGIHRPCWGLMLFLDHYREIGFSLELGKRSMQ